MALTDDEKKIAKAYNIGYVLSGSEPRLLDKIIKSNPNNEFVKMMQVGRDHHHFHVGIPRKDYSREFKNGFYNGRTLAEHEPKMIERLMATKGLNKDYKKGLESAQREYSMKTISQKIDNAPKAPPKDLRRDESYQKGFNTGYRTAESIGPALRIAQTANEKYAKYFEGMKAGKQQYDHDLAELQEKDPNGRIFPDDPRTASYENALIDHKLMAMDNISSNQFKAVELKDGFSDVPLPKWLQKKEPDKNLDAPKKDKDIDLDR